MVDNESVSLLPFTLPTLLQEMDTFPPFSFASLFPCKATHSPPQSSSSLFLSLPSFSIGRRSRGMSDREIASIPPPSLSLPSLRCQSPKIAITASDNWAPNARARRDWPAHRPQPTFSCNLSGKERKEDIQRARKRFVNLAK